MENWVYPTEETPFLAGETNLNEFLNRPLRMNGGAILLCKNGTARVTIDLIEFDIQPETEIILLTDSVLMLLETDRDFLATFFSFTSQLLNEACHRLDAPFFRYLKEHPTHKHSKETYKLINNLFDLIISTYEDHKNRFRSVIAKNYLQIYMLNVYNKAEQYFIGPRNDGYSRQEELFHQYIELVMKNFMKQRDVAFYANEMCISKGYLATIVHNVIGATPKVVLDKYIIQEIKVLLTSTDLSVQQIADYLHFPDQSYLGRYFKHHTSQSPIQYRSKWKNKFRR
ncbi:MAG: helix-turn-helix domain-containing protein [Bacteroidales bacterium]|nr:helix-turn-helix domain-containing protein [Bacteroidales bacterium]